MQVFIGMTRVNICPSDVGVQERSYRLALRIVRLSRALMEDPVERSLYRQVLRSGTSVGVDVEEAQAAQSRRDLIHKLAIARKEARETRYWLRVVSDTSLLPAQRLGEILEEADTLVRILTAIIRSTQSRDPVSETSGP